MLTSRLYGGSPTTSRSPRKIRPDVGSSKPPIIRSVVVLPHPDGPSSAKNEPRGISSETRSTARTSANSLTTSTSRTSGAIEPSLTQRPPPEAVAGAPVVELLPELEVEEGLGGDDLWQRPDPVRHVEQRAAVGADDLDEEVEAAGGDDDVVGLLPVHEHVRDVLRRARRPDADHRLRLEAEPERVGDAGDLEDALVAEAPVARTHGRLGDAERGGDPPERLAAVLLQGVDDPPVDAVELRGPRDGPPSWIGAGPVGTCPRRLDLRSAAQCEGFLPKHDATRQSGACTPRVTHRAARCVRFRTTPSDLGLGACVAREAGHASFTQTCLIRVYSSIEYMDMSFP